MDFKVLLVLLAVHFIADFPFQGDFLAMNKGKSWEIMFYHCAVYAGSFVVFADVSLLFFFALLVTHFVIDTLKARYKVVKHIWQDQLLHIIVLLACFLLKI